MLRYCFWPAWDPMPKSNWIDCIQGDKEVVLLAPPEVHGCPGDTVNLTCVLQPVESETLGVMQIKWKRLEPCGGARTVAEFHWGWGHNISKPDHVQFMAAGKDQDLLDASLTLTDLEPDDEANYTCEVITFQKGTGRARIWLRVFYPPQVSMSLYDGIGPLGHRETSLSCDARGNPKPKSYEWSTTTGSLPPYAVPQGARLLLQPSRESINTTFICRVSNALGTVQIPMRVQLPGTFQEQSQWSLIVSIVVLVAVVLGVLFYYYCCFRMFRQDRHKSSGNEEIVSVWTPSAEPFAHIGEASLLPGRRTFRPAPLRHWTPGRVSLQYKD